MAKNGTCLGMQSKKMPFSLKMCPKKCTMPRMSKNHVYIFSGPNFERTQYFKKGTQKTPIWEQETNQKGTILVKIEISKT